MVPGILGKKIGMTQIFDKSGNRVAVTVLEAGPCVVRSVKNVERDGYNAVQLSFGDTKASRIKKPQRMYLEKNKLMPKKFVRELRLEEEFGIKVGDQITNDIFQEGDFLDIVGRSKGKGFQGGMKRWGWSGGRASHGSMSHRVPGSIGASSYPSRVMKGQSMPGHLGNARTTTQNLKVVDVNTENNTIAVKGAVPGADGTYLIIRYARKRVLTPRKEIAAEEKENGNEEKSTG